MRPAVSGDAAAIACIYAGFVRDTTVTLELDPPDAAEIAGRMEAVRELGLPYLVAELDGVVAGYGYASSFRPRPGYRFTVEDSIYVDPTFPRRGVGSALLRGVIAGAQAAGARQMIAVIGGGNGASIAFHAAHGFAVVGTLACVGYKFDRWVDVTMMQRAL